MADPSFFPRFKGFLHELKRRKVYHVGAVYLVVGFGVAQGAQFLFDLAELPVVAAEVVAPSGAQSETLKGIGISR